MRFELVLVLLFAVGSYSLQCYVCDSDTAGEELCASAEPDDLSDFVRTCTGDGEEYCRRIEKGDRIMRMCTDSSINAGPYCVGDDRCASTGTCSTDKCNHGNGFYIINHLIALIGLSLAFFLTH